MGISPQQFTQLQERVRRPRPHPTAAGPETEPRLATASREGVVLGIDPSLRGTGWGIVRFQRKALHAVAFGTLRSPPSLPRTQCLLRIASGLRAAIRDHAPTCCVVEGLFYAQNLQTALLMGEARGVCLLAAAEAGLEVCEIAPRKVKQAIVGYGGAQKLAVARMVQRLLNLPEIPDADAADALALALAHGRDLGRPSLNPPRRLS